MNSTREYLIERLKDENLSPEHRESLEAALKAQEDVVINGFTVGEQVTIRSSFYLGQDAIVTDWEPFRERWAEGFDEYVPVRMVSNDEVQGFPPDQLRHENEPMTSANRGSSNLIRIGSPVSSDDNPFDINEPF